MLGKRYNEEYSFPDCTLTTTLLFLRNCPLAKAFAKQKHYLGSFRVVWFTLNKLLALLQAPGEIFSSVLEISLQFQSDKDRLVIDSLREYSGISVSPRTSDIVPSQLLASLSDMELLLKGTIRIFGLMELMWIPVVSEGFGFPVNLGFDRRDLGF